jgi:putative transposase
LEEPLEETRGEVMKLLKKDGSEILEFKESGSNGSRRTHKGLKGRREKMKMKRIFIKNYMSVGENPLETIFDNNRNRLVLVGENKSMVESISIFESLSPEVSEETLHRDLQDLVGRELKEVGGKKIYLYRRGDPFRKGGIRSGITSGDLSPQKAEIEDCRREGKMLSYKFRLYPNKTLERTLNHQLELCCWLYNRLLSELNLTREKGIKLGMFDLNHLVTHIKRNEKPELKEVYSKALQMVAQQLWYNVCALAGLKRRGKKVGKLRFKGQGWFKTLNFNQSGFRLENGKLVLSKVGGIPIRLHREIRGRVKGVIVKRERSGKWFAIFQVEDEPEPLSKTGRAVGIDVGVRHFLTDSKGRQVENPRFYERSLERIRIRQRQLSRKRKGSKNRGKAKVRLARAYERLVNQRNDFLHKLSRFYVNGYDLIAVERLNISGMAKNHRLGKKILDASWGKFFQMLSYKAERAGRRVVEVDPRGTSQNLPEGFDRDHVAACRILSLGLGRPEVTPAEMGPLLGVSASAVVAGQAPSLRQEAPAEAGGSSRAQITDFISGGDEGCRNIKF